MADPSAILLLLHRVDRAAKALCKAIDKAINETVQHDQDKIFALKNLRKGVDSLIPDTLVYKVLLNPMKNGTDLSGRNTYVMELRSSSYTHRANNSHYHRWDGREAMVAMTILGNTLKAIQILLEKQRHEVTTKNKKPRAGLYPVYFLPAQQRELIRNLDRGTKEIVECRRTIERAFRRVWNSYVVAPLRTGRPSSVDNVEDIQDRVGQALDSILHAFHEHPFAVSPEGDSRVDLSTLAILNHNHGTATQHENLARRVGKAWVDDRFPKSNAQVGDIDTLKTSLFGLLWSGTVEQLKRHGPDDPEGPKFKKAVEELEKELQGAIVRSKKERFVIAFCGMVNAGKSLFLNALMGRAILPTDGERNNSCTLYHILSIIVDFPSTAWPCRLRHVDGQTIPELQFQAEPFLDALKKLQAHQYGRMMQNHPPEDIFEAALYDALSVPSDEEILFRTIHSQWIDLDVDTRNNLLKFETPGFTLPRMATGEENVKDLVSFMSCHSSIFD